MFTRQPSARGPGSTFEDFRQRQRVCIEPETASHAISDAVEQRHRQRPPLHDKRRGHIVLSERIALVAESQHAIVDEETAVSILGKAGQSIDVGHINTGILQRLDQRIGQPLRQFVQRH